MPSRSLTATWPATDRPATDRDFLIKSPDARAFPGVFSIAVFNVFHRCTPPGPMMKCPCGNAGISLTFDSIPGHRTASRYRAAGSIFPSPKCTRNWCCFPTHPPIPISARVCLTGFPSMSPSSQHIAPNASRLIRSSGFPCSVIVIAPIVRSSAAAFCHTRIWGVRPLVRSAGKRLNDWHTTMSRSPS